MPESPPSAATPSASASRSGGGPSASIQLKADDVLFLNRQLASMARLNMPIAKGLRILARDVSDPDFKAVIESIQQDMDEGLTLKDALAKFPRSFSSLQIQIVRAGEETGNLAVILDELNEHTQAMRRIKSRVLEAITYPALVSVVIFAFILFFLLVVAPQFEDMLVTRATAATTRSPADARAAALSTLPSLTRVLFQASAAVQHPVVLGLLVSGTLVVGFLGYRKVRRMGDEYDDLLLRVPLFGKLFESAALLKVTRTMRDLLLNGVSMVETLRLVSTTVGRNRIQAKLEELRLAVEEGGSFARNLAGGDVFPDTMVWKLQMAEEKGIIEDALAELGSEFEITVEDRTTLITKLLTPLLLVGMGGVVFLMFLACFVPLTRFYA